MSRLTKTLLKRQEVTIIFAILGLAKKLMQAGKKKKKKKSGKELLGVVNIETNRANAIKN